MASTRQLKSRIRSVRNNTKITKAMELVAASKLRRAQEATKASHPYSLAARELLTRLSTMTDVARTPFFAERTVHSRLVVLITSNRGLAGAYNANVIKLFMQQARADRDDGIKTRVLCIGAKGARFVAKLEHTEVIGVYTDVSDQLSALELRPILVKIADLFLEEAVDVVDVVTTRFVSSFTQQAEQFRLLPAGFESTDVSHDIELSSFEPSVEEVLEGAVIRLLEAQLYQALLDARASEHSMRRAAMKNATDNAEDIADALTLEMNKVRQAAITQELSEISAGVEAMQ